MILTFEELFPAPRILSALRKQIHANQRIFLVGGAVRDRLMGKQGHDLDLIVSGDVRSLARRVADELKAAFYMMDEQHQTARVICTLEGGTRNVLDFAALRGVRIEQDLGMRDFTINAIAIDLDNPQRLIDPLNGSTDLRNKVIRACYPDALEDDPIRVLRAVRHSLDWNFRINPETLTLIKKAAGRLESTSIERRRDELFRILESSHVRAAIEVLDRVGALPFLLPDLVNLKGIQQSSPHIYDGWQHTLSLADNLQALYSLLVANDREELGAQLIYGMVNLRIGRFRERLQEHYTKRLNPERSLRGLLLFSGLYHDTGKPVTTSQGPDGRIRFLGHESIGGEIAETRARALALSSVESERIGTLVRNHMRIHHLAATHPQVSRRSIFRYFREMEDAGVDLCLLSLADTLATYGVTISPSRWEIELGICRQILTAWFEQSHEIISPPRLISGNELMVAYNLKPGPQIGQILERIKEAQATGEVTNQAEAMALSKKILDGEMIDNERADDGT